MKQGRWPSPNHTRPTRLPGHFLDRLALRALCFRLPASRTDVSLQPRGAASHFVRRCLELNPAFLFRLAGQLPVGEINVALLRPKPQLFSC